MRIGGNSDEGRRRSITNRVFILNPQRIDKVTEGCCRGASGNAPNNLFRLDPDQRAPGRRGCAGDGRRGWDGDTAR